MRTTATAWGTVHRAVCLSIIGSAISVLMLNCASPQFKPLQKYKPPQNTPKEFRKLQAGGYVIFFRHTHRKKAKKLVRDDNLGVCKTGTNLSKRGKKEALAIKATLQKYQIAVGEAIHSPTCRTREMAKLLFGKSSRETRAVIYLKMFKSEEEMKKLNPELKKLLSEMPPIAANRVIVSHGNVLIKDLVGFKSVVKEGDAAIIKPLGNGQYKYEGKIKLKRWLN